MAIWPKIAVLAQRKFMLWNWHIQTLMNRLTGPGQTGLTPHYTHLCIVNEFVLNEEYVFPGLLIRQLLTSCFHFSRQPIKNVLLRDRESCCCLENRYSHPLWQIVRTPTATPNQLEYKAFLATLPFSLTATDLFTHNPEHCRTDHVSKSCYNHWMHYIISAYCRLLLQPVAMETGGPSSAKRWSVLTVCYRTVKDSDNVLYVLFLTLKACLGETDLQLGSRQVDISHHLSTGVFHLQTRVELQEVEAAVLAVEVLHCTCTDVPHHLSQLHCALRRENSSIHIKVQMCSRFKMYVVGLRSPFISYIQVQTKLYGLYPFHILKHVRGRDGGRSLLYNLLVASLHRTVSAEQGNGIAILISQDLDL